MSKEIVCIVCPNSCRLLVGEEDGKLTVKGHECRRGEEHGMREYRSPLRMLTTTVAVRGGVLPRLPVISSAETPKAKLDACLQTLYRLELTAPIRAGDVVVKNICDTGVDVIASRSLRALSLRAGDS